MATALQTEGLKYEYDQETKFEFPDLKLSSKDKLLLMGESGCGKTTFLHLLSGLLTPTFGKVWVDSQELHALSGSARDRFRGKNIGLIYQRPIFLQSLTVAENLQISPFAERQINDGHTEEVSRRLGIEGLLKKRIHQLSVGELQRVGITRALLTQPKLILADEPTSALDNRNCEAVIELLVEQAAQADAALIVVTHDDRLRTHIDQQITLESKVDSV